MAATPISGTTTTYVTNASDTHREDLSDLLTNIDTKRCVFTDAIGKGSCSALLHEWPEDELADPGENKQVDGADAEFTSVDMPTAPNNRVQLSAKWFLISTLQSSVDKAGRKDEVAYQTEKKLKEIARDIEWGALNNVNATAFSSGTAGEAKGFKGWMPTTHANHNDFDATYLAGNDLTWDLFNAQLQTIHESYGDPNLVLAPGTQKRIISSFDQAARLTINADASSKKITAAVDYIETDFGVVEVKMVYFLDPYNDGGTYYDWLPIVDTEGWKLCFLKGHGTKAEKLAKTGLAEKVQISSAWTLECRNIKRNGAFSKLSRA